MRSFTATNTNDIEEDADRGCRACKEICCLKKMFLLLCCDLDFLSSPCGAEGADIGRIGLPRRIKQSSSALSYAAVVTLFCLWTLQFFPLQPKCDAPTATTNALVKTNRNLPGSLPQEVAHEVPPWSATGKGSVVYGMLLEEITHIQNTYVKVISAFRV